MRRMASEFVRDILLDGRIHIVPREQTTFVKALELYESRPDKSYSLTDCISMNVCKHMGIAEVITNDAHFRQEGFSILLQ